VLGDTASDRIACEADVAEAADEPNLLWGDMIPMFGTVAKYVLTSRGDVVRKYQSREELLQLLGPIDSPEDALLLLYYDQRELPCTEPNGNVSYLGLVPSSMRKRDDGYQVLYLDQRVDCAVYSVERITLRVATDGIVTELFREMITEETACAIQGAEG